MVSAVANIKTTYLEDLEELRIQFAAIDKKDPIAVKKWFESRPHLSTNDHAQIFNRSLNYVRRLRKFAGIRGAMPPVLPVSKAKRTVNDLVPPENWDNPEWLRKVASYSIKRIAKACNTSRVTIYRRFKKYGIVSTHTTKSKNKCCTKAWCYRHYVELEWTQEKCAKAAGICQQAFSNWLNRFKIAVRNNLEGLERRKRKHVHIQLWVKKLILDLENHSTVRKVYLRHDHVHVRFMNYFWETYYPLGYTHGKLPKFSHIITKRDAKLDKVPRVIPEYESEGFEDILDENGIIKTPHIMINRKELNKASFMERRVAVHEYCRQITQRGWIWPEHPEHVLASEWSKLQNYKETRYIKQGMFTIYGGQGRPLPGKKLMEHFFDISDYSAVFRSPRAVMAILNRLLDRDDLEFNFHNVLRMFSGGVGATQVKYPTFRFTDPAAYATLFKRLGIKGKILDISPDFGNKAAASAIEGLEYYAIPDARFAKALDKGFAEFIGLKYHEWNDDNVDVLVYDNNFGVPDLHLIKKYTQYAKRMLIFVPRLLKNEYQAKLKPKSVIKIRAKYMQPHDYIFIW